MSLNEKSEKSIRVFYEFMIFASLTAGIVYYKPSIFLYLPLFVSMVVYFFNPK